MEREGEVEEKREVEKKRKSGRCSCCGRGRRQTAAPSERSLGSRLLARPPRPQQAPPPAPRWLRPDFLAYGWAQRQRPGGEGSCPACPAASATHGGGRECGSLRALAQPGHMRAGGCGASTRESRSTTVTSNKVRPAPSGQRDPADLLF